MINRNELADSLLNYIASKGAVNLKEIKLEIAGILDEYTISKITSESDIIDLQENIQAFIFAKNLEGCSKITLDSYKLELKIFTEKVKKKVSDIATDDIRNFLSSFPHLKMSSIGRKLSVLKSFFSWLVDEGIIKGNPTAKIKPPKTEKLLPKALSIEELELLRESCKTNRQRSILEVLYATGCRLSELHDMCIHDINYQSMSCKAIGKGSKEREVYLSFKAIYHLKKYLKNRSDDNTALFVTERKPHTRLSKRAIQREVDSIAELAGIEKAISPHTLRHTFSTLALNNGCDIVAIQHLLGHASTNTTQRYAVLSNERKEEQYRKFMIQ